MSKWKVSWEIDIEDEDAIDPYTAALKAFQYMTEYSGNSGMPVFEIVDKDTDEKWSVDLEEPEEDAVLPINE